MSNYKTKEEMKQYFIDNIVKEDYKKARELGLTSIKRWEEGTEHHPMSVRLMDFLCDHDYIDMDDYFGWKIGGDGDNGESLMYEMDAFFELLDKEKKNEKI